MDMFLTTKRTVAGSTSPKYLIMAQKKKIVIQPFGDVHASRIEICPCRKLISSADTPSLIVLKLVSIGYSKIHKIAAEPDRSDSD